MAHAVGSSPADDRGFAADAGIDVPSVSAGKARTGEGRVAGAAGAGPCGAGCGDGWVLIAAADDGAITAVLHGEPEFERAGRDGAVRAACLGGASDGLFRA